MAVAVIRFGAGDDDDRGMVASKAEVEAEERRSRKLAAAEDRADAQREAHRAALKAARKEKARRKRSGAAAFMHD